MLVIKKMETLLTNTWVPFTDAQTEEWNALRIELEETTSGLGISQEEKGEIVRAMDMGKGAWYLCPKGHPYVITECHGAMEVDK